MIRRDKIISLFICLVIMALIIPKTNILLLVISLTLFLSLSIMSFIFIKTEKHHTNSEIMLNRGEYLKLYFVESIIFILYCVLIKAVVMIIPYFYRVIGIYLLLFILLTKDILYRSLSFRICKITYTYSKKNCFLFIFFTNLVYSLLFIFGLVSNIYRNILPLERGQYIVLVIFLLILLDQFYLFIINKQRSLYQEIFRQNLVHNY